MDNIPSEITSEILSRIDFDSVLPSKQVCNTWRAFFNYISLGVLFTVPYKSGENWEARIIYADIDKLIDSDTILFTEIPKNSSVLTQIPILLSKPYPDEELIIGSCNGLVCGMCFHRIECGGGGDGDRGHLTWGTPTIIFNPVTREFVRLQGTNANIQGLQIPVAAGFGYHHSTNEYKVVRIYDEYIGNVMQLRKRVRKVQVYTLGGGGGGGWRYVGNVRYTFYFPGIHANGSLYWVDYSTGGKIIAFDLGDEEFQSIPTPPQISISLNSQCTTILSFRLRVLGGYLCLVHQKPGICVDIWSLKKKNTTTSNSCSVRSDKGNFWFWTKEFSITWDAPFRDYDLITITKSNVVLLRCNFTTLYCYDLRTEILSKLWKDDANSTIFDATPHTNSNISLKDLGENSVILPYV